MLKFVPDHLKIKAMCMHVVKKLPFVTRSVLDQCKTQKMCVNAIPFLVNMRLKKCVIKPLIIMLMH